MLRSVQILVLLLGYHVANADSGTAFPRVSASEQSIRDAERSRILQEELANERTNLRKATAERTERSAVSDAVGAGKAEEAQRRAQANIVALEREIRMTGSARESVSAAQRGRSESTQTGKPGMALAPWWDVYGAAGAMAVPGIRVTNHSRTGAEKQ